MSHTSIHGKAMAMHPRDRARVGILSTRALSSSAAGFVSFESGIGVPIKILLASCSVLKLVGGCSSPS
jgi:hypothetical protein